MDSINCRISAPTFGRPAGLAPDFQRPVRLGLLSIHDRTRGSSCGKAFSLRTRRDSISEDSGRDLNLNTRPKRLDQALGRDTRKFSPRGCCPECNCLLNEQTVKLIATQPECAIGQLALGGAGAKIQNRFSDGYRPEPKKLLPDPQQFQKWSNLRREATNLPGLFPRRRLTRMWATSCSVGLGSSRSPVQNAVVNHHRLEAKTKRIPHHRCKFPNRKCIH